MLGNRKFLVVAVATLTLVGCGTTANLTNERAANAGPSSSGGTTTATGASGGSLGRTGGGLTAYGGAGSATDSGQGSSLGSGGGGSATDVNTGGSGGLGGSTPGSVGNGTPEVGDGPGVTATTINVAGLYDPNAGAEDAALGLADSNPGNENAEENAMVAWVNAHGGIAHRQVHVVYYEVQNEAESANAIYQGACSDWTQDHKTFVLYSGTPAIDQCTASAHGIGFIEALVGETTPALQQFPADFNIDGFTIDRGMKVTVEGLAHQGYFSPGAKVGIVTWDENDYRYGITNGADPALAALGIDPKSVPVEYIAVPQSYGDLGATSASAGSAVLKFHSMGINHVILLDGPAGINNYGILCIEWTQQANSQEYYPTYGLNSADGPSIGAGDYPEKELVGSIGVGWYPPFDLDSADYEALTQSPNQKLCVRIMGAAGQTAQNPNQASGQFGICDEFFFLQYALGKVTGPLNQATAMAAIDSVGSSYPDMTTFGTFLSASQRDGAQLVRDLAFNASCDCFRYTSPAYNPG